MKRKRKEEVPVTPVIKMSRVELALRFGSTPNPSNHPKVDEDMAHELFDAARRLHSIAMEYQAMGAQKRALRRFGMAPPHWDDA